MRFFGLGGLGSVIGRGFVELSMASGPSNDGLAAAALGIALLVGIQATALVWAIRSYWAALRTRRALVWLRRFGNPRSRLFHLAIPAASPGLVHGITLQDSEVPFSRSELALNLGCWAHLLFLAGRMVGVLIAALAVGSIALAVTAGGLAWLAPLAVLPLTALAVVGTQRVYRRVGRRFGSRAVPHGEGESSLKRLVARIRDGQAPLGSLQVLKLYEADWQPAVRAALLSADVLVIDVSDISEAIRWELEMAAAMIEPRRVILAFPVTDREVSSPPPELRAELEKHAPRAWLTSCNLFPFAVTAPWYRRGLVMRKLAKRLTSLLEAISAQEHRAST